MQSFVSVLGLVGIMSETKTNLFEVYLDKDDNTHFYHNSVKVVGLPLEGNERIIASLFKTFEKHRGDMLAYLCLKDNRLWWKLKDAIEPPRDASGGRRICQRRERGTKAK